MIAIVGNGDCIQAWLHIGEFAEYGMETRERGWTSCPPNHLRGRRRYFDHADTRFPLSIVDMYN